IVALGKPDGDAARIDMAGREPLVADQAPRALIRRGCCRREDQQQRGKDGSELHSATKRIACPPPEASRRVRTSSALTSRSSITMSWPLVFQSASGPSR